MTATATGADDNVRALRQLGHLVRTRRRALGFTLAEVAQRSGLSAPFLSQVENGIGTPSLTSLFAIARVLETTAEALLAGPPLQPVVVVRAQEGAVYPVSDDQSGSLRRQLTTPTESFSAAEYVIEPGADLGGFEASAGRDLLHVLEGHLTVEVRRDEVTTAHELATGDTILYDTADAHRWSAAGEGRTRFLHIVAPPTS
jgi:transcriptional regulator with XRE-family HTH domain